MRLLFLLIAPLMATTVLATGSLPDGKQILTKTARAMHNLNFQGTVAFLRGGKLEPMQYFHDNNNNNELERLLSLNSPLREITRQSGKVSCLYKETDHQIIDNRPFEDSFLLNLPQDISLIEPYYTITVADQEEKVALLPTYVVELKAKDPLRYSRKIWVEKNNSLPIKAEVYDLADKTLETMSFTALAVNNAPAVSETLANSGAAKQDAEADKTTATAFQAAPFTANPLPAGFRVLFFTQRTLQDAAQPVSHLTIGDGLALVSVYLERNRGNTPPLGDAVQTVGAVKFYSQSIAGYDLTVMGEVPAETITLIAKSIKLKTGLH